MHQDALDQNIQFFQKNEERERRTKKIADVEKLERLLEKYGQEADFGDLISEFQQELK